MEPRLFHVLYHLSLFSQVYLPYRMGRIKVGIRGIAGAFRFQLKKEGPIGKGPSYEIQNELETAV